MIVTMLKQDTLSNKNIFSPEEEVATGGSAPMRVRRLVSKTLAWQKKRRVFSWIVCPSTN